MRGVCQKEVKMWKKWLIILLSLIVLCNLALAVDIFDLRLECEDDYCVKNRWTYWNLTIRNIGEQEKKALGFNILNTVENTLLFTYEEENAVTIVTDLSHTFSTRERVPPPNMWDTFIANVCLITEPPTHAWGSSGKRIEYCYRDINITLNITDCLIDIDCEKDEVCHGTTCVAFECGYCQYPDRHICNDYECCTDDVCPRNKVCKNHLCADLECRDDEYIVNHTCTKTLCRPEEGIVNFTCVPLVCNYDEHIKNHECAKLYCDYDEYAFNHTCRELNCSYAEFPLDHQCMELNCEYYQHPVNHSCHNLSCNFIQMPEEHECRINSDLVLWGFLILTMLFLIFLNLQRFAYTKKKRLVELLMDNIKSRKKKNIKEEDKDKEEAGKDAGE
jgi:hypothetical protein